MAASTASGSAKRSSEMLLVRVRCGRNAGTDSVGRKWRGRVSVMRDSRADSRGPGEGSSQIDAAGRC